MNSRKPLLVLPALLALASPAFAQVIFNGANGGVQTQDDVGACQTSGGGSRIKRSCERETRSERTEQLLLPSIKLAPLPIAECEAIATTEYFQQGTSAHVQSTLQVSDCTAASGTLTFALRIRDANGAVAPLEFDETWQRTDGQNVKLSADYPIGENVSLASVRVRNLRCTCADSPAEQADAGGPAEHAGAALPAGQPDE